MTEEEKRKPRPGYFIDGEGNERPDRRTRPTPAISRHSFFGGKRRGKPFADGGERTFVDVYGPKVWIALTLFLALNFLDAHFTLIYLQRGGAEGNPVAQLLLDQGIPAFYSFKNLGIGFGAVLFCFMKNFPNVRKGVFIVLSFYQLLFFYHLALYFNVGERFLAA
jgi:hypothetical protein